MSTKLDKWLKEINEHTSSGLLMERDVDLCIQIIETMRDALININYDGGDAEDWAAEALAECEKLLSEP